MKLKNILVASSIALASAFTLMMINNNQIHAVTLPKQFQNNYYLGNYSGNLYEYHFGKNNLTYSNDRGPTYKYYNFQKAKHGWNKAIGYKEPIEQFKYLNKKQIKGTVGKKHSKQINMKRYSKKFVHNDDDMNSSGREAENKHYSNTLVHYAKVTPKSRVMKWFAKHIYKVPKFHYVNYSHFSTKQYRPAFIDWAEYKPVTLVKNYKQAKFLANKSKKFAKHYHYTKVIKNPNTKFEAKIAKGSNKHTIIYKIKYNHHYYYYVDNLGTEISNLTPLAADYTTYANKYAGNPLPIIDRMNSSLEPTSTDITVNKKYKSRINNPKIIKSWNVTLADGNQYDVYVLHNGEWHETPYSDDVPAYISYDGSNYAPSYMNVND